MLEQKGTNKKSHRAGAWRRIDHALVDHALVDHALVDHALVARANFAIWPRKKTGKFRSPAHFTNFPVWNGRSCRVDIKVLLTF